MARPMAALLILPLMLHTATGTSVEQVHLEIPKLCLQGPKYWCQSEKTASLCMKEDYCMEHWTLIGSGAEESAGSLKTPFWENMEWRRKKGTKQLSDGWGLKCKACKFLFKFLGKKVADDQSDEEISSALDRVCKKVSFPFRSTCKMVIRRFREAIIRAFEEHKDPATFCANINMCEKPDTNSSSKPMRCRHFSRSPYLQTEKFGETDMELSHLGDPKLCLQGSEYWCQSEETASLCMKEDYCMELWQNAPSEHKASSHGASEDATKEEKGKKKNKNKKRKKDKKRKKGKKNTKRKDKSDLKCSGCTKILTNLQNYVGENLDDDTINGAVDSMCDEVDESVLEICTTMRENNRDDVIEAVKNGDIPKDVCTQIQMCEGQELEDIVVPPVPAPSVSPTCIFCQAFISFVKPLLTDNMQKKGTGQVLENFCIGHLGNSTMCNNFLSTYGTMLKHALLKPWDQVSTCQEVGACEARIPKPQFGVKLGAASLRKGLEDMRSTQLVIVNV